MARKRPTPPCIRTAQSPVNQLHAHPSESEVGHAGDTAVPEDGTKSPHPDLGEMAECVHSDAAIATPKKGRALLLDDDPILRELITAFLAENGYDVVQVQNGGEGVREVLSGDFTLVICDLNMPGLPGDMFYRAVERIQPELCKRFIFITGHRDDAKTDAFIAQVNGFVVWKPFQLKELGDAITVQEVCVAHQSVFDAAVSPPAINPAPVVLRTSASPEPYEAALEAALAAKVAAIIARAQAGPVPKLEVESAPSVEPEARGIGAARRIALAALVVLLILGGRAWNGFVDARNRAETALEKRLQLQARWSAISPNLDAVIAAKSKIATGERQLARLSADRATPRWTTVLRLAVPGIEILDIHVRDGLDDSGTCEAHIRAVALGTEPRLLADRFRQAVAKYLMDTARESLVSARFEEIADVPGTVAGEQRVAFVVVATMGSREPSVATQREKQ